MKLEKERQCFECDEDGHWYLIHVIDKELFDRLLYKEDDETKFIDAFDKMRLSMHISNYTFLDCKEIEGEPK